MALHIKLAPFVALEFGKIGTIIGDGSTKFENIPKSAYCVVPMS